jgi:hypothetical protein
MPRDASGNYTLPAGNPVVVGTTIDASWANATMDDLATAMQDSLSRSGDGGMLVAFQNAAGSEANPGMTWVTEVTSGFYLAGTNDMRASIAGVDRAQFRADSSDPFRIWNVTDGAWKTVMNEGGDYTITGTWHLPEASITEHEAALTILETQITDGALLARFADQLTVFNNTDDATGDVQVGSTAANGKSQSLSLVNLARDVSFLLTTSGINFGFYDNTAAEWAVRCIPSTSKVEIYGENAVTEAKFLTEYKPNDEDRTSTTTYADDTDLHFGNVPIGIYWMDAYLKWQIGAAGIGFKVRFIGSATSVWSEQRRELGSDASGLITLEYDSPSTGMTYTDAGDTFYYVHVQGTLEITGAGSFGVEWAQNVSSGSILRLKKNSSFTLTKIG